MPAEEQSVERAVFAIGLEEPVEGEKGGQERADPQDCRSDPRQEVEVRADAERDGGDDGEEEDDAGRSAAAARQSELQVAQEKRPHNQPSAAASSSSSTMTSSSCLFVGAGARITSSFASRRPSG